MKWRNDDPAEWTMEERRLFLKENKILNWERPEMIPTGLTNKLNDMKWWTRSPRPRSDIEYSIHRNDPERDDTDCKLLRGSLTKKGYSWYLYEGKGDGFITFRIISEVINPVAWQEFKWHVGEDISENRAVVIATCKLVLERKRNERLP